MSLQRVEYFKDLYQDASQVSDHPQVIAACVLSDSLNGLRKALLDISCSIEALKPAEFMNRDLHDHLTRLNNSLERLSYFAYKE
jgi:hypothetical protein